jgi:hypothetical protein
MNTVPYKLKKNDLVFLLITKLIVTHFVTNKIENLKEAEGSQ